MRVGEHTDLVGEAVLRPLRCGASSQCSSRESSTRFWCELRPVTGSPRPTACWVLAKVVALAALGGSVAAAPPVPSPRCLAARPRCAHAADPVVDGRSAAVRRDVRYCGGAGAHRRPCRPAQSVAAEVALGYESAGPPTVARIPLDWRSRSAVRQCGNHLRGGLPSPVSSDCAPRRRPPAAPWPGCSAAACCCSPHPGHGQIRRLLFSMHMAAHMLLSMLVPILLVLGASPPWRAHCPPPAAEIRPAAGKCWPDCTADGRGSSPSGRRHGDVRGGFYALYFGGIFDAAVSHHGAHVLMNLHFLMSGLPVLLGRHRNRSHAAVGAAAGQDRDGLRLDPAACLLPGVVLMEWPPCWGERFYRSRYCPGTQTFSATSISAGPSPGLPARCRWWSSCWRC